MPRVAHQIFGFLRCKEIAFPASFGVRFAHRFRLRIRLDETVLMTIISPLEDELSFGSILTIVRRLLSR